MSTASEPTANVAVISTANTMIMYQLPSLKQTISGLSSNVLDPSVWSLHLNTLEAVNTMEPKNVAIHVQYALIMVFVNMVICSDDDFSLIIQSNKLPIYRRAFCNVFASDSSCFLIANLVLCSFCRFTVNAVVQLQYVARIHLPVLVTIHERSLLTIQSSKKANSKITGKLIVSAYLV